VPGADIAKTAKDKKGHVVPLVPISLAAPYGLGHEHADFVADYDGGKMDGFDKGLPHKYHLRPFGYAPRTEVQPYYDMATQYVFGDRMFQSNQGPSFPAHQYIISGTASALPVTSFNVSSNPLIHAFKYLRNQGGCDSLRNVVVSTINPKDGTAGPTLFPCFERPVLSDFLDQHFVSWRHYQDYLGAGLWHSFDAIQHVRYGFDYANVITPPQTILSDISTGNLPGVSWVMPDGPHSDHAGNRSAAGPSWVAAVVNAVGKSKYWNSTAIFVTWDDWGGWYDHVAPPIYNSYELGFRVPLVVISPYAKSAYVSHVQHEFGSILAFTEEAFGIPKGALGTTDVRSDDLMDAFDFTQSPRAFVPIKAPPFTPGIGSPNERNAEDP